MYQEQIGAIIEYLEQVRRRPGMYIGRVDYSSLLNHLYGIEFACRLFGLEADGNLLKKALLERGWKNDTRLGSYPYMVEQGLSEVQIVDENLVARIEMWKKYRTNTSIP
jgi:hypothetical protein